MAIEATPVTVTCKRGAGRTAEVKIGTAPSPEFADAWAREAQRRVDEMEATGRYVFDIELTRIVPAAYQAALAPAGG